VYTFKRVHARIPTLVGR